MRFPTVVIVLVFVAALVPSSYPAAVVAIFVLAGLGAISLFLRLRSLMSSDVVPALVAAGAAALVPLIATLVEFPWILLGLVLALGLGWLGVDQVGRWATRVAVGKASTLAELRAPLPSGPARTEKCAFEDKTIFESRDDARRVVENSRGRYARGEVDKPLDHEYYCPYGDHWHVSSQPRY